MSSAKKTIKTITPDGTDSIARRARFRAVAAYVTYYVQRTTYLPSQWPGWVKARLQSLSYRISSSVCAELVRRRTGSSCGLLSVMRTMNRGLCCGLRLADGSLGLEWDKGEGKRQREERRLAGRRLQMKRNGRGREEGWGRKRHRWWRRGRNGVSKLVVERTVEWKGKEREGSEWGKGDRGKR